MDTQSVPVEGFPRYEVSCEGTVRNVETGRCLSPIMCQYPKVGLYARLAKNAKLVPIHLIVARAFVPDDDPAVKTTVNHLDGNTANHHADNLEWCSQAENNRHALETGLRAGGTTQGTKVRRIDPAGVEPSKDYSSMKLAARDVGLHPSGTSVHRALDWPSRSAGGYKWVSIRQESVQPVSDWRPLITCDGIEPSIAYEVSEEGRIRNPALGRELSPSTNPDGYKMVFLSVGRSQTRRFFVHRLVAAVYCFQPEDSRVMDVDHIDGVRANNHHTNLRYITRGAHNKKTRGRPVVMKDPATGKAMATYPTVAAAAKAAGICESGVRIGLKRGSPRWAWAERGDAQMPEAVDPEIEALIDLWVETVTL